MLNDILHGKRKKIVSEAVYALLMAILGVVLAVVVAYKIENRPIRITLEATNPWIEQGMVKETFRGVPVKILNNLIQSESSWRPFVENRNPYEHSVGLAQVNMRWFPYFRERYGIKDPKNPWQSLLFAADYLNDLKTACGSWEDAVVAYKVGLSKLGKEPPWVRELAKKIAHE